MNTSPEYSKPPFSILVLFALLAGYPILSAVSTTNGFPDEIRDVLKYARIMVLTACFVIGCTLFQFAKLGETSKSLLVFTAFFLLAGAWSNDPVWAFAYKSFFLAAIVTGICLALAVGTEYDLTIFCRFVVAFGILGIALIAYFIRWDSFGDMFGFKGQLWVGNVNPNTLAQTAAIYVIISLLSWRIDPSFHWRILTFGCATLGLILIFLSGSRGGMLTALAGGFLVTVFVRPITRNLAVGGLLAGILIAGAFFWITSESENQPVNFLSEGTELRLLDSEGLTKDTRSETWSRVIAKWQTTPVLGVGWNVSWKGHGWGTVFSAYLQVLLETGLIGFGLLMFYVFRMIGRIRATLFEPNSIRIRHSVEAAFAALAFAMLLHGLFESSMVLGTTPHAFLLAFATQKLDREVVGNRLI